MAHSRNRIRPAFMSRRFAWLASTALALTPGMAVADGWEPYVRGSVGPTEFGNENVDVDLNGSVFLPVWQNESQLVYVDIRGQARNDDATAELGVAYREMVDDTMIIGVGAHYQLHNSQFQNTFERLVVEGEVMTLEWDARLRGYIPLSSDDEEYVPEFSQLVNVGSTPRVLPGLEAPMYGIDGEVGRRFWVSEDGSQEVRAFAGGFYFAHPDYEDSLAGPEGRVEYRIYDPEWLTPGSRMEFMVEASWDDVREDEWRGLVTLQIPLQAIYSTSDGEVGPPTGLSRRMLDVSPRDTFTTQTRLGVAGQDDLPAFFANGAPIENLVFIDESGSGTQDGKSAPNADTDADFNTYAGMDNTLIVVLGQNGLIGSGTSYAVTGQNVFVLGGGSGAAIATPEFNFDYVAPGTRPTMQVLDPGNVHGNMTSVIDITSDDVTVQGIDVTGGFNGIHTKSASNLVLRDIMFSDAQATVQQAALAGDQRGVADGIFIDGGDNIVIDDFRYQGAPGMVNPREGDAIDVRDATNVAISNVTIDSATRTGILLGGVDGFSITNATITDVNDLTFIGPNSGDYGLPASIGIGVFGSSNGTISNVMIDGVAKTAGVEGDGILLQASQDITVSDFSIAGVGRSGISIVGASTGIEILNGTISNTSFNTATKIVGGIAINGGGGADDILISSVAITGSAGPGVHVVGASNVDIVNVGVSGLTGVFDNKTLQEADGIFVRNSENITISGFSYTGNNAVRNGDGIHIQDTKTVSISNTTIDGADRDGILFVGVDGFTVANVAILNSSDPGGGITPAFDGGFEMFGSGNGTITGLTVANVAHGVGVNIANSTGPISLSDFSISGTQLSGVQIAKSDQVTIQNGTISNVNLAGSDIQGGIKVLGAPGDSVTLSNIDIANAGPNGIVFQLSGAGTLGVTMSNVDISGVDTGLRFRNGAGATFSFLAGSDGNTVSAGADACREGAAAVDPGGNLVVNGGVLPTPAAAGCP